MILVPSKKFHRSFVMTKIQLRSPKYLIYPVPATDDRPNRPVGVAKKTFIPVVEMERHEMFSQCYTLPIQAVVLFFRNLRKKNK